METGLVGERRGTRPDGRLHGAMMLTTVAREVHLSVTLVGSVGGQEWRSKVPSIDVVFRIQGIGAAGLSYSTVGVSSGVKS
jgi:hypothetical protein